MIINVNEFASLKTISKHKAILLFGYFLSSYCESSTARCCERFIKRCIFEYLFKIISMFII